MKFKFSALCVLLLVTLVALPAFGYVYPLYPRLVMCPKDNYGQASFPSLPVNFEGCFVAPANITVLPAIVWNGMAPPNVKMNLSVFQYAGYESSFTSTSGPVSSWDSNRPGRFVFDGYVYSEPNGGIGPRMYWHVNARLKTMVDGGLSFATNYGLLLMRDYKIEANYGQPITIRAAFTNEPVNIVVKDGPTISGTSGTLYLNPGAYTIYLRTYDGRVSHEYRLTIKKPSP